jgi:hypothetical protein
MPRIGARGERSGCPQSVPPPVPQTVSTQRAVVLGGAQRGWGDLGPASDRGFCTPGPPQDIWGRKMRLGRRAGGAVSGMGPVGVAGGTEFEARGAMIGAS